jgi:hypothetical protein
MGTLWECVAGTAALYTRAVVNWYGFEGGIHGLAATQTWRPFNTVKPLGFAIPILGSINPADIIWRVH